MRDNMQKIKLLKLYELLRTETDAEHPISRIKLCERLNKMGISSNVRTLSLDIETLRDNGYEISSFLRNKERFYYVPEPALTIPEMKILIDAVQAASFVTEEKTSELVEKIAALGGSHRSQLLKKNIVKFNTRKHTNEFVFSTVDVIEDAINRRRQIAFNYFHLNENAERTYRNDDAGDIKRYQVEPVALIFNEDNYYLMAYSQRHPESTANYRVDRMANVEVLKKEKLSKEALAKRRSAAKYTKQVFKMFGGEEENVILQFDKSLIEPVFDKFGEDTPIKAVDEMTCKAKVRVQISPTFFGWLAQFGEKMRIAQPDGVKELYVKHIRDIK